MGTIIMAFLLLALFHHIFNKAWVVCSLFGNLVPVQSLLFSAHTTIDSMRDDSQLGHWHRAWCQQRCSLIVKSWLFTTSVDEPLNISDDFRSLGCIGMVSNSTREWQRLLRTDSLYVSQSASSNVVEGEVGHNTGSQPYRANVVRYMSRGSRLFEAFRYYNDVSLWKTWEHWSSRVFELNSSVQTTGCLLQSDIVLATCQLARA